MNKGGGNEKLAGLPAIAAIVASDGKRPVRWCILRTAGQRTVPLAASLAAAGFEAWTPQQTQSRRLPRGSKAKVERIVSMMPTFVFVRADTLPDLVDIMALPVSPHPPFSIFRWNGRIPLIGDSEIEGLRTEERKVIPKAKQRVFTPGEKVHLPEGAAFGGLTGVVEGRDGKHTLVCFGGATSFKIATFLLQPGDVFTTSA